MPLARLSIASYLVSSQRHWRRLVFSSSPGQRGKISLGWLPRLASLFTPPVYLSWVLMPVSFLPPLAGRPKTTEAKKFLLRSWQMWSSFTYLPATHGMPPVSSQLTVNLPFLQDKPRRSWSICSVLQKCPCLWRDPFLAPTLRESGHWQGVQCPWWFDCWLFLRHGGDVEIWSETEGEE